MDGAGVITAGGQQCQVKGYCIMGRVGSGSGTQDGLIESMDVVNWLDGNS